MPEPRIPPLEPPYEPEVAEELEKIMPPGVEPLKIFRTLAWNPRILRKIRLGGLLDKGSIEKREREIVILRTGARCGAEYEWGVHAAFFAARYGISEEQIAATFIGTADDPCWSEKDALLIRLVDELHDTAGISDGLWKALSENWQPPQLVELIILAGFYHMISFFLNGVRVGLEDNAPRFPAR